MQIGLQNAFQEILKGLDDLLFDNFYNYIIPAADVYLEEINEKREYERYLKEIWSLLAGHAKSKAKRRRMRRTRREQREKRVQETIDALQAKVMIVENPGDEEKGENEETSKTKRERKKKRIMKKNKRDEYENSRAQLGLFEG